MAHILRLAGIEEESIVDGPGLRMTVFVQGCLLGCPGCQNPQTHDLNGGTGSAAEDILEKFCADPLLAGITFSGGEPFLQPEPLLWLAREVHARGWPDTASADLMPGTRKGGNSLRNFRPFLLPAETEKGKAGS